VKLGGALPITLAALALGAMGCGSEAAAPRAQWKIVISTDAAVPQLGDRLLVEILDEQSNVCPACRRMFSAGEPSRWPFSFGIVAVEGQPPPRVRAVLHRAGLVGTDGLPPTVGAHISAVGRLPPTSALREVDMTLSVGCFGLGADPKSGLSCDPATATLEPERVLEETFVHPAPSSATILQPTDCAGTVPQEMVCIPGGAFIMGSGVGFSLSQDLVASPEHLVRVSAFALDREEMTVGNLKGLLSQLPDSPLPQDPNPGEQLGACTFVDGDSKNDELPVTCISFDLAAQACALLGKRLPSEAEWEWAAGNTSSETVYAWGGDEDICNRAVIGVGRFDAEMDKLLSFESTSCRPKSDGTIQPWGPVAGGKPDDVTTLGVHNLGGNVSEWVADAFARYDDECWDGSGPQLIDPLCPQPGSSSLVRAVRGASWSAVGATAPVATRNGTDDGGPRSWVGFRCAKSMTGGS